jgi:endoglycosylceramidase
MLIGSAMAAGWLTAGPELSQAKLVTPPRAATGWSVPKLDVQGRWLVDREGRVAILHGSNLISKLRPYTYESLGFGDRDLRFLRDEGINAIRLGFIWKALEPQPGQYDDKYLDGLIRVVRRAEHFGLLVMFDFHQDLFNEAFSGEGFPDWATNTSARSAPFPANMSPPWKDFMDNKPAADGVGLQDRLGLAWRHVAERLADDRNVIFEPLNEPYPFAPEDVALGCLQPAGCPVSDQTRLAPLYAKLLAAIRAVDAERLVFFEPWYATDYSVRSWLPHLGDPRVGYAPHQYCPTGEAAIVYPPVAPGTGCEAVYDVGFANMAAREQATGEPTLLNEFGAGADEDRHNEVEDRADQQMFGWFHWAYWAQDAGEPRDYALLKDIRKGPVDGNVRLDQLRAITRPYPRLIAGTPQGWSYQRESHTFDLRYSTARVGGGRFPAGTPTEVAIPSRQYPDGYAARVEGGAILSAPNAPDFRVAACPGADEVRVHITATGTSSAGCSASLVVPGQGQPGRGGGDSRPGGGGSGPGGGSGAGEAPGRARPRPRAGGRPIRLRLSVSPGGTTVNRRTCFVFMVTTATGARRRGIPFLFAAARRSRLSP